VLSLLLNKYLLLKNLVGNIYIHNIVPASGFQPYLLDEMRHTWINLAISPIDY